MSRNPCRSEYVEVRHEIIIIIIIILIIIIIIIIRRRRRISLQHYSLQHILKTRH